MSFSIFLFLSLAFLTVYILGPLIEKIRVPWIFAALIVGAALAINNPFPEVVEDPSFNFLADLGMYFMLFIIGLEIDLKAMKKLRKLIITTTVATMTLATLFGGLFVHYVFDLEWTTSILVALSFATVGEAILLPILDEFKILHTKLGQAIIGVATLDDAFELITLIWLSILLGESAKSEINFRQEVIAIIILVALTIFLFIMQKILPKVKIPDYPGLVVFFMLIIFFVYLGIGEMAGMEALAAILAGVVTKYLVSMDHYHVLESHTKLLTYGFLAPIFFLKVGMEMNMSYLVNNLPLIVAIATLSLAAKLMGSIISARNVLGLRQSILMGLALSIRFSTSIIIITVLYQNGFIDDQLFSIVVATSIIFKFIVPPLFANLLVKWDVAKN